MMGQEICIRGSKDFFYLALEDRLKRSGINITSDAKNASTTIGIDTNDEVDLLIIPKGRHDSCVLPRAVPIVEAMTALVLVDHYLRSKTNKI